VSATGIEAIESFLAYAQAFEQLEPQAILPYYHQPCLMISPQGVRALSSHNELAAFFSPLMADLRGRGYEKSRFLGLQATSLGSDLALVHGTGVWLAAGGEELQRFGLTYTWRRGDGSWRLVVVAIHEPPAPNP
jgi:ketosteroid isomerase-like protein